MERKKRKRSVTHATNKERKKIKLRKRTNNTENTPLGQRKINFFPKNYSKFFGQIKRNMRITTNRMKNEQKERKQKFVKNNFCG